MKKQILALALAGVMAASMGLAGCGNNSENSDTQTPQTGDSASTEKSGDTGTDAQTPVAADGETYTLIVSTTRTGWIADWYDEYFADLTEKSGGRLTFQVNQNNELGSPADSLTMFQAGGIDMLDMNVSASGASMPVSDIAHVPYFIDDPATAADVMWALDEAGYCTEYDGMHVLMYLPTDMMMIASTKKIETIDDMNGLKLRASSPMILSALERCGASPVSIDASEVYMALSQKTIDASVSSPLFMWLSAYPEVTDYLLYMPICTGMCYLAVNDTTWNSLPEDLQQLITEETAVYYDKYIDDLYANTEFYKQDLADQGMDVYDPSEELEAAIKEKCSGLIDEYEATLDAAGYDGAAIVEIAEQVIAEKAE